MTPTSRGTPWDINIIYTPLKSTFSGLQFCRRHYKSIFIHIVVASQNREIRRNSDKIWRYSSSRSSKVIDLGLGVSGKPIYDILLVINCNYSRICYMPTVFEIFTLKDRQESPADADKPALRESMQKLLQFDVSFHRIPFRRISNYRCIASRGMFRLLAYMVIKCNKKAQLTLSNPRVVKACRICSNSTCFVSFHRIPFPRISKFRPRPI